MKGTFQIVNERIEAYTGKRGHVEQRIISLLDLDAHPMLNTVDYILSDEEKAKNAGKVQGKKVELAITNVEETFSGRLRVRGQILALS